MADTLKYKSAVLLMAFDLADFSIFQRSEILAVLFDKDKEDTIRDIQEVILNERN